MDRTTEQAKAEEYLLRIRNKVQDIQNVLMEIEALEYAASGMGAVRYDKEHVDGGSGEDRLIIFISDALEKRADLERFYAEVEKQKEQCYRLIKCLPEASERIFLEWYYINAVSVRETMNKLYVSKRKAYYIKNNALQHFGELLKK